MIKKKKKFFYLWLILFAINIIFFTYSHFYLSNNYNQIIVNQNTSIQENYLPDNQKNNYIIEQIINNTNQTKNKNLEIEKIENLEENIKKIELEQKNQIFNELTNQTNENETKN